jgi:hypothetical protein
MQRLRLNFNSLRWAGLGRNANKGLVVIDITKRTRFKKLTNQNQRADRQDRSNEEFVNKSGIKGCRQRVDFDQKTRQKGPHTKTDRYISQVHQHLNNDEYKATNQPTISIAK